MARLMAPYRYALAIGSNRPGRGFATPKKVLSDFIRQMGCDADCHLVESAPIIESAPIGAGKRTYANGAIIVETTMRPDALLIRLKSFERQYGRRRGRRWGDRVLDIDIVLWSGGLFQNRSLTIPHQAFRMRDFVLDPLVALVPDWRDPVTGLTIRQLHYRVHCATKVDLRRSWP
jgi:2-amino-4-hydroxy-6-hydroxymethyldihydropteridine diphosphokinase